MGSESEIWDKLKVSCLEAQEPPRPKLSDVATWDLTIEDVVGSGQSSELGEVCSGSWECSGESRVFGESMGGLKRDDFVPVIASNIVPVVVVIKSLKPKRWLSKKNLEKSKWSVFVNLTAQVTECW